MTVERDGRKTTYIALPEGELQTLARGIRTEELDSSNCAYQLRPKGGTLASPLSNAILKLSFLASDISLWRLLIACPQLPFYCTYY